MYSIYILPRHTSNLQVGPAYATLTYYKVLRKLITSLYALNWYPSIASSHSLFVSTTAPSRDASKKAPLNFLETVVSKIGIQRPRSQSTDLLRLYVSLGGGVSLC